MLLRDTLGPYIGERGAERQAHAATQARQEEGKRQIDALARQLPELRTQFATALESTREQVAVARERASVTARRALRELDHEPTLRQKGEPVVVQQARLRTHLVVNRELLLLPVPRRWRMDGAWLAHGWRAASRSTISSARIMS
uniref:hypothetical protein n=1 Tax=Cupriavidus ulmosensis TaxID=3065913 RepID=UPI00296B01E9|nr:hypothetical protein [Cupriavidus sp. CV2]